MSNRTIEDVMDEIDHAQTQVEYYEEMVSGYEE
jgi:hypothetical protein